ncbi:hypothetical protein LUS30_004199 [Salmonella enterica]|nr:hypothetical protein [Salmonella enterica]EIV1535014.1 hypothetical protein [Salmonella enterica]EKI8563851.1 hypothetical protein [Salmonella enterica]
MNTGLTLLALVAMTPDDYEQSHSDSCSSHQALTQAVVWELLLTDTFLVNCLLLRG